MSARKILFDFESPTVHLQRDGLTSKCGILETNFHVGTEGILTPNCVSCLATARISPAPVCHNCDWELVRRGSEYFCQHTGCARFGLSVNDGGDTPAEHEQRCEDEGVERERRAS